MKRPLIEAAVLGAMLSALPALGATPDWLITSKAKLGLFTSELRSKSVHVDTNGGVVTLFGKVATEAQRSFAEQQVKQLEGVREVHNRLQVARCSCAATSPRAGESSTPCAWPAR